MTERIPELEHLRQMLYHLKTFVSPEHYPTLVAQFLVADPPDHIRESMTAHGISLQELRDLVQEVFSPRH